MIDLEDLLHGVPTSAQVKEFFREGEFHEESYLVAAIKKWLLTPDQAKTLYENKVSVEDLLNGRVENDQLDVAAIFAAWNTSLGFHHFGY